MIICYYCKQKLHKNEAKEAWVDRPGKGWKKVYRCKKCYEKLRKMLGCPKEPDTIVVKSAYNSYGVWSHKEIYTYVNDGKYRIERKECVR